MAEAADPIGCAQVLDEELRHLRPAASVHPAGPAAPPLEELLHRAHEQRLSALCLSGGGVRSASFSLGVLEGLCRRRMIDDIDYLSTVSGGGYAGGWLSAWRYHAAADQADVAWPLTPETAGGPAEPGALIRLRRYVRYLAPHTGLFSVDLWALLATIARNLVLMWLVLLPLLSAILTLPYIYFAIVRALDRDPTAADEKSFTIGEPSTWLLLGCVAVLVIALGFVVRELPSLGGRRRKRRALPCAWSVRASM